MLNLFRAILQLAGILLCLVVSVANAQSPATNVSPGDPALNRNILELLNRLDQLENEIRQLRGDTEVMSHEIQGIKRRQRELYMDVDRRLHEVELGARPAKPAATASSPAVPASTTANNEKPRVDAPSIKPVKVAKVPTGDEKVAYKSAFNLLKEGRYEHSIKAFTNFLKKYPSSSYAGNAQYWLGEANYVSRKYNDAVKEFNKVMTLYPASSKVSDAMLKKGFTHYELQQWKDARKVLENVMSQYPDTTAARLAETRLQRMKKEGH